MSNNFRKVRSQAVTLWKEAYAYLTSINAEPHNRLEGIAPNETTIPGSLLSDLRNHAPQDPDAKITFWMGLDESGPYPKPVIIVSNDTGTALSGRAIYNGTMIIDSSGLNVLTTAWNIFCFLQHGNGEYKNDYVFMRLYSYKWEHIDTLTNSFQDDLTIEIVAHTIGAQNAHFDTNAKDPNDNLEGWIALDLLLTSSALSSPQTYYDFVMPCPKICP